MTEAGRKQGGDRRGKGGSHRDGARRGKEREEAVQSRRQLDGEPLI